MEKVIFLTEMLKTEMLKKWSYCFEQLEHEWINERVSLTIEKSICLSQMNKKLRNKRNRKRPNQNNIQNI